MDSQALVVSHVVISLIAIASGFVVLKGLFDSHRMPVTTALFLVMSVLTSVGGFFFHRDHLLPSHVVGIIALVVLAATTFALYVRKIEGHWRGVYVIGAVLSLYLNVFVLVVQLFLKVPSLHALAPNGSEPPFAITQGVVLVLFIIAGALALKRFRPAPASLAGGAAFRELSR